MPENIKRIAYKRAVGIILLVEIIQLFIESPKNKKIPNLKLGFLSSSPKGIGNT
jgi:hypothetical protein